VPGSSLGGGLGGAKLEGMAMRNFLLISIVMLGLTSWAWADDVFVSNKPFKGQIYGVGSEIRFSLLDLAKALDFRAEETSKGWLLGALPVKVVQEHGVVWIDIDDLPPEMVRVVRNKDFGTVDIYRVEGAQSASSDASWGGEGTLVVFGASWCPTTADMRPTVSEIEQSQIVHVVYVDVEAVESPAYQEFDYLFEGDKIPYFVLLGPDGNKLHSFMGFHTYSEMLATLGKYIQTQPNL
jgi:thiol-disulfide isomerase/thioredoxin